MKFVIFALLSVGSCFAYPSGPNIELVKQSEQTLYPFMGAIGNILNYALSNVGEILGNPVNEKFGENLDTGIHVTAQAADDTVHSLDLGLNNVFDGIQNGVIGALDCMVVNEGAPKRIPGRVGVGINGVASGAKSFAKNGIGGVQNAVGEGVDGMKMAIGAFDHVVPEMNIGRTPVNVIETAQDAVQIPQLATTVV